MPALYLLQMMKNESKTLYIPLYGKAYVSRKGIILNDKKAEEIWAAEGFELKGKSALGIIEDFVDDDLVFIEDAAFEYNDNKLFADEKIYEFY